MSNQPSSAPAGTGPPDGPPRTDPAGTPAKTARPPGWRPPTDPATPAGRPATVFVRVRISRGDSGGAWLLRCMAFTLGGGCDISSRTAYVAEDAAPPACPTCPGARGQRRVWLQARCGDEKPLLAERPCPLGREGARSPPGLTTEGRSRQRAGYYQQEPKRPMTSVRAMVTVPTSSGSATMEMAVPPSIVGPLI